MFILTFGQTAQYNDTLNSNVIRLLFIIENVQQSDDNSLVYQIHLLSPISYHTVLDSAVKQL